MIHYVQTKVENQSKILPNAFAITHLSELMSYFIYINIVNKYVYIFITFIFTYL